MNGNKRKEKLELLGGRAEVIRKRNEAIQELYRYERLIEKYKPESPEVIEDQRGTTIAHGVSLSTLKLNAKTVRAGIEIYDGLLFERMSG